jgi:hypothetical protein
VRNRTLRTLLTILILAALTSAVSYQHTQAAPQYVTDPDVIIEKLDAAISKGDTLKLAAELIVIMDTKEQKESLEGAFAYFRGKVPEISDRVLDKAYGTTIRRIVTYHAYSDLTVLYVRYTLKRFKQGWILVNFDFKTETQQLFPPDYNSP